MAVWTGGSQWAVAFAVGLTHRHVAGQSEAEALAQERGEGELVVIGIPRPVGGEDLRRRMLHVGRHDGRRRKLSGREWCEASCHQKRALY